MSYLNRAVWGEFDSRRPIYKEGSREKGELAPEMSKGRDLCPVPGNHGSPDSFVTQVDEFRLKHSKILL